MPRVVVTAASFCKNSLLRAEAVKAFAGHEVVFHPVDPASSPLDVASALNGFDAAIVGREAIGQEVLALSNPPAIIAKYGVGMDNIDPLVFDKLTILSAPGSNAFAVAEHTLGLILALMHNIAKCDRLLRGGTWWKDGGVALAGKTVAVIGVGAVGSRVARLLRAFDCEVIGVDIVDKGDFLGPLGASQQDLQSALKVADLVTLHVPLTKSTATMVKRGFLAAMKPGSWLVNTSRGEIVVESDLLMALNSGHLAGAGLDVFQVEPVENKELVGHAGVVSTPHIGGNSREAVLAMGRAAVFMLAKAIKNV